MKNIAPEILAKAQQWLTANYDEETRKQVQFLIDNNPEELIEAFYQNLEFGTGGLRGIMGVGTNRMNKYTVGFATQGLANYLLKMFVAEKCISVAIAYDSRNNSKYFAQIASEVLSANGIKVYVFEELRPTPELSFAIRHLKCNSGIVITASHNPKEYNGYKVYWDDGGQLVAPHDKNVITEVLKIKDVTDVKFAAKPDLIVKIGKDVDEAYYAALKTISLNPEIIKKYADLKIVFTPLHGTGIASVPPALKLFGFTNIHIVPEQDKPDGNFPTTKSPNPEEPAALAMAIEEAKKINADIVMATDPDADRVGIAVKNTKGDWELLNGNQTASILIYYLINQWKAKGKIKGKEYIVKTIVTSELLKEIAAKENVPCYDVLTGFKYIAEIIRQNEDKQRFIGGGEESYGYLMGEFVRDKDAVMACCMIAEAAAWANSIGKSLYEILIDIYVQFGFYKESLLSLTKKGIQGAEEIKQMMVQYRSNPPKTINGVKISYIKDYLKQEEFNMETGAKTPINLPKSDVIQFFLIDGSKITVRPSGTEPKIKFYFGIKDLLKSKDDFEKQNLLMAEKINGIIEDMKLK